MSEVQPAVPAPATSACGTGLTRSIWPSGTSARTLLVPKTNSNTQIGVAIATARAIERCGSRHSPAMIATYSNPLNAPSASLLKMFTLSSESVGAATASGW